jgi:molybdate transport system ATP-binding protein
VTLDAHVVVERGTFSLDVRLTIPTGGVLAVMGPNGSGKTTLLEALTGITPLTAGHVHLDGAVLDDTTTGTTVPPRDRRLGVALQDGLLFGHLSARENVAFGPRAQGTRAREARTAADALLTELGLAAHARARSDRLSGGQAQRVAIARALAVHPRALLLDEPFGALDVETRSLARDVVRRHVARGLPTLLVTHDLRDALDLADELLVLEDGRAAQRGTPQAVADDPATTYAARVAAAVA